MDIEEVYLAAPLWRKRQIRQTEREIRYQNRAERAALRGHYHVAQRLEQKSEKAHNRAEISKVKGQMYHNAREEINIRNRPGMHSGPTPANPLATGAYPQHQSYPNQSVPTAPGISVSQPSGNHAAAVYPTPTNYPSPSIPNVQPSYDGIAIYPPSSSIPSQIGSSESKPPIYPPPYAP
ncbi:expressed hypothetical protein [Trichoplax adhaerens]|uniref:Uncharacterized protein n=1 Tax=Trichoplax adhaerens TaxID=10228 RepID=B3RLI0_TRIAD|nr:expressed hypothetical protein [Trichoplax adhaerens]EDV29542.1 expressed hypothetical protein [Trichoplax adhaerens]|eukprot:XP_002108744.1 expressed hypothetical protein [Trichoplax adhaerens]